MKRIKIISCIFICIILLLSNICFAVDTGIYTNIYNKPAGSGFLEKFGRNILGVIQVVGVSIGVIMLTVIGIKYMTASVEEKAKVKEQLIPYFIGAILLFGGSGLMGVIANWANNLP